MEDPRVRPSRRGRDQLPSARRPQRTEDASDRHPDSGTSRVIQITTKGDANNVADPWGKIVLKGATAYRMVGVIPLVGWPAVAIGHFVAGLLLILAGALLVPVTYRSLRHPPERKAALAAKEITP